MKRTLFLSILIVLFIISFVGCDNKPSPKELYDLQVKCGKQGEEFIKNYKERYDLKYGTITHQSHYNKKLNKCFVRSSYFETNRNLHNITDVNENVSYGDCSGGPGLDLRCITPSDNTWNMKKTEWDKIVELLMTE